MLIEKLIDFFIMDIRIDILKIKEKIYNFITFMISGLKI